MEPRRGTLDVQVSTVGGGFDAAGGRRTTTPVSLASIPSSPTPQGVTQADSADDIRFHVRFHDSVRKVCVRGPFGERRLQRSIGWRNRASGNIIMSTAATTTATFEMSSSSTMGQSVPPAIAASCEATAEFWCCLPRAVLQVAAMDATDDFSTPGSSPREGGYSARQHHAALLSLWADGQCALIWRIGLPAGNG